MADTRAEILRSDENRNYHRKSIKVTVVDLSTCNIFKNLQTRSGYSYPLTDISFLSITADTETDATHQFIFSQRTPEEYKEHKSQKTIKEFYYHSDIILLCPHNKAELEKLLSMTENSVANLPKTEPPTTFPKIFLLEKPSLAVDELKGVSAIRLQGVDISIVETNLLNDEKLDNPKKLAERNSLLKELYAATVLKTEKVVCASSPVSRGMFSTSFSLSPVSDQSVNQDDSQKRALVFSISE